MIMMQANRKELAINLRKDKDLPEFIESDEDRLQQVLLNLLLNAIKYTNKGSVTLRISRDLNENQMLRFEVSDTGIGIPFEKKVMLFKLFGGDNQAALTTGRRQRSIFGYSSSSWLRLDH